MKKILFLHSSSELYGSDMSLLNLIKNLDKDKYEVNVVLPGEGPLVAKLNKYCTVTLFELSVLRRKNLTPKGIVKYFFDFIKSCFFLSKFIKINNIDIVYTNTAVVFPGGVVAKMMRKKSIWHIREIISNKFERYVVSKIVNSFSTYVIANSSATLTSITKKENSEVVYNTIDSSLIKYKKVEGNSITIGMAGRINRWKGQGFFIDACKKVVEFDQSVKILIAGETVEGEEILKQNLEFKIEKEGLKNNIKLIGQIDDMNDFYNYIDIFVLPSIEPEPFGIVILEAMARGIPVVATNHGGPTEIIENEVSGLLVDYRSEDEMAETLIKLIKDRELSNKISRNGKEKFQTDYSIDSYMNKIERIINKV